MILVTGFWNLIGILGILLDGYLTLKEKLQNIYIIELISAFLFLFIVRVFILLTLLFLPLATLFSIYVVLNLLSIDKIDREKDYWDMENRKTLLYIKLKYFKDDN